jgi:nitrate reductase molybdenum cofactor assembly chaperone
VVNVGVYACLAEVLEYPDERLGGRLDACVAALAGNRAAGDAIAAFRAAMEDLGLRRLQELYTSGFDMDADCALYAGHHLFGATVRRGIFMACLAAQYREAGVDAAPELPDYLPAILRYIERAPAGAEDARRELVADVLLPATRTIADALERRHHPYAHVMRAVLATPGQGSSAPASTAAEV